MQGGSHRSTSHHPFLSKHISTGIGTNGTIFNGLQNLNLSPNDRARDHEQKTVTPDSLVVETFVGGYCVVFLLTRHSLSGYPSGWSSPSPQGRFF